MKEFSVVVAYEDPLKRLGIYTMLKSQNEYRFTLFDHHETLSDIKKIVTDKKPDFIIIDAHLNSDNSGILLAKYTRLHATKTKVIMMAFTMENSLIKQLKELNIKWLVLKTENLLSFKKCASRALKNEPYISKSFRNAWNGEKASLFPHFRQGLLQKLSKQEIEVLNQVALGKTNTEISQQLFISEKTIKNHRYNICKKLHLQGNNALFKYTIKLRNALKHS